MSSKNGGILGGIRKSSGKDVALRGCRVKKNTIGLACRHVKNKHLLEGWKAGVVMKVPGTEAYYTGDASLLFTM